METRGLWDQPPPPRERGEAPASRVGEGEREAPSGPTVLSVGAVTRLVRETIRRQPRLNPVWVEGEIGNVSVSAAGHAYFTLKDERAQLRCVVFREERLALPLEPRTGPARRGPGPDRRLRAGRCLPALRRLAAAGRRRRSCPALRDAPGPADSRKVSSTAHASDRCLPGRAASAWSPRRAAPCSMTSAASSPAAGRWPASSSAPARCRAPPPNSPSCARYAVSAAGPTPTAAGPSTSSSWRAGAVRSRTSGPSTRKPWSVPSPPIRDRSSSASGTRPT